MKALNNILRNALPVSAAALTIGFSLTSCSQPDARGTETETPIVKTSMETPANLEPAIEYTEAVESPDTVAEVKESISIIKAVACEDIEGYDPVGEGTVFDVYGQKVWIYSQVKMPKGETGKIKHIYYLNDKEIQTVELDVKGPTFRTRSYKTIHENLCGDWKVEIRSEMGTLLDTVEFETYPMEGC